MGIGTLPIALKWISERNRIQQSTISSTVGIERGLMFFSHSSNIVFAAVFQVK